MVATNQVNGAGLWRATTHAPLTSGPTVKDGMVVVATSDAQVFALCENTGAILWHTCVPNAVFAAPAVDAGRVVVKTVDGKVIALNAQNGEILWEYDHGAPMLVMRCGGAPQIVDDNKVIVGFSDGKISALDLQQGQLLWEQVVVEPKGGGSVDQMADIVGDPVVDNNVVYVATYQGNISALNACTGDIYWQHCISSYTGLTLDSRNVYVTDAVGFVWAFDRDSGAVVWRQTALYYRVLSAPIYTQGGILVGDAQGFLHWLCPADGHFVARVLVESNKRVLATPAVYGNTVFVQTINGNLSAWRFY